jgi:hypothetical protein
VACALRERSLTVAVPAFSHGQALTMERTRTATITRRIAAVMIAAVAVIHFALASEYLDETTYIGVLFIAGGVAAVYVAARLWISRDLVAWSLGGLLAAGMFVGFILSRTVGLPSFHESEWETSGIAALILEAGYIGVMGWWLSSRVRRARATQDALPPVPARSATAR